MGKSRVNIFSRALMCLIIVSCGEEKQSDASIKEHYECNCNDVFLDPEFNYFYTTDRTQPYSGPCTGYFKSGKVAVEKTFNKGKLDGTLIEYYENGVIKSEWNFLKGRQHGDSKGYSENGYLLYHTIFYKGEQDSVVKI